VIELQGDLETRHGDDLSGKPIGNLHFTHKVPYTITGSSVHRLMVLTYFTQTRIILFICGSQVWMDRHFFFTEVRGTCRKEFCLLWIPRDVDFRVSCSQIPRCTFAGIRTHDPLRVRRPNHSATTLHDKSMTDIGLGH
jgi:hypothetical protein